MPSVRNHRVFIALPAFVVLVGLSSLEGVGMQAFGANVTQPSGRGAHALTATAKPVAFATPRGIAGTLQTGGSADIDDESVRLERGTLLIASEGLATVHAGNMRILAFAGGIGVVNDNGRVTVAALLSPALVQVGDATVLVPVGFQWRSGASITASADDLRAWLAARKLQALPTQYRAQQLRALLALHPVINASSLDNPALSPLLTAAFSGKTASVATQLSDPVMQRHLASASADDLGALVTQLRGTDILFQVAPTFLRVPGIRTLLSVHSQFREYAWISDDERDIQGTLVRMFALPQSDTLLAAASDLVIDRWSIGVAAHLADQADPLPFLQVFLAQMRAPLAALTQATLPERHARYARAIADIAAPYEDLLGAPGRAQIDGWLHPKTVAAAKTLFEIAPTPVISAPAMKPEQAIARVRTALEKAQAMFTRKTSITADTAAAVKVEGVVLATAKGDQLLSFVYDAPADQARGIDAAGRIQPFGLSLAKYLEWVKKVGVAN
jgi:hypothetical protein